MSTLIAVPLLRLRSGPNAGKIYTLRRTIRVGRHPYNEISLGDRMVSRYHCWVKLEGDSVLIEDLKSGNGTYVNEERIGAARPLRTGDCVRIGATEFTFVEAA